MSLSGLAFPVILIAHNHHITNYKSPRFGIARMNKATRTQIENLNSHPCTLIDAHGWIYVLKSITIRNKMWLHRFIGGGDELYNIGMDLAKIKSMNFDEVKQLIANEISSSSIYNKFGARKRWIVRDILNMRSMKDLCNYMSFGDPYT